MTSNSLAEIAGKKKFVPLKHELIRTARDIGISFGDWNESIYKKDL